MDPIPQEELWRCFFQRAPYAAVALSPAGIILECNANYLRMLGHLRSSVVGRPYREFVTSYDATDIAAELQRLADGKSEPTATGFMLLQHKNPDRGAVYCDFIGWRIPVSGEATHLLIICFEQSEGNIRRTRDSRPSLGRTVIEGLFRDRKIQLWLAVSILALLTGRLRDLFDLVSKLISPSQ